MFSTFRPSSIRAQCLIACVFFTAGCGSKASSPTPTSPSPAEPAVTETFASTLPVGGAKFYSFSIAKYGTVIATLTDIGGAGVPPTVVVNMGLGTPLGTTCSASSVPVQVAGDAQVTTNVTAAEQPGTYCVIVSDAGNLFAPAAFTVSIAHP
jgi:hypothetical protein